MGAAAYNRGSRAIRHQIDSEARPVEFDIMDRLNAIEKRQDAGRPAGTVILQHDRGAWWILDAERREAGFGYWYPTLDELMSRWEIVIIGMDTTSQDIEYTATPII